MYEVILSLILSKPDFNLIKEKEVVEIRMNWKSDEKNNMYYRPRLLKKNCPPGFV